MTSPGDGSVGDLLELADRLVGMAEGGEELEAYVARSSDTSVRVYEGEVEQLAVAESLGVGVRVVRDGRQGFAYCGTFDPGALAETVAEARDNAAFSEPDEAATVARLQAAGLQVLATTIDGEVSLDDLDLTPPTAWLFGPEAHGLPTELAVAADHRVHIPMPGQSESLNISSAASICLYQSARAHRAG